MVTTIFHITKTKFIRDHIHISELVGQQFAREMFIEILGKRQ